jgi:outer membrane receptor protein involved in Fe transport
MFLTDNFGYYLTAGRKKTGGFRDNSYLAHNDASFKLVYDKGDILDVSLYGDFIDREYGRPGVKPPSGTQNFYARGVQVYSGEAASMLDKGGDEDGHIVFQAKSDPLKWLGLNFKGEYTHMENNNFMRYYNSWTGGVPGQETWTTNEVKGFEGNLDLKPFDGANLLIGMEYRDYDWKNKSIKLDDDGNRKSGTRSRSTTGLNTKGAYAEVQYRPCKYVKALAGLRHEDHSTFGYEDIPRFGLVFNPLKETVLKFSRGKHFKAPTLNDLFWPYEDWGWGSGTEGNSNLKPETGWHTDLTAEQTLLNEKIFITLSYFKWDIDNKIRWVPDASFFYRPQNLDTYEADGWEVGTKIGPFYNFTLAVSYTDSDSKENKKGGSKRQALYTPDDQFKGSLTYWTEFGLNATATANYVGARPGKYDNDTDTSPSRILKSYWTVDLKIEQRLYDHWIVTLTGNNLFDKEYETYVDRFYDSTGAGTLCSYQGAGQSVFLSVGYEF